METPTFRSYTCCGDHDAEEMRAEHIDKRIQDLRNCVGCHRTGLEDEPEAFRDCEAAAGMIAAVGGGAADRERLI